EFFHGNAQRVASKEISEDEKISRAMNLNRGHIGRNRANLRRGNRPKDWRQYLCGYLPMSRPKKEGRNFDWWTFIILLQVLWLVVFVIAIGGGTTHGLCFF